MAEEQNREKPKADPTLCILLPEGVEKLGIAKLSLEQIRQHTPIYVNSTKKLSVNTAKNLRDGGCVSVQTVKDAFAARNRTFSKSYIVLMDKKERENGEEAPLEEETEALAHFPASCVHQDAVVAEVIDTSYLPPQPEFERNADVKIEPDTLRQMIDERVKHDNQVDRLINSFMDPQKGVNPWHSVRRDPRDDKVNDFIRWASNESLLNEAYEWVVTNYPSTPLRK